MYRNVPRPEILDALIHLRDLHRQSRPSNDLERQAFERRELVTKNLLSNLRRTGDHPTLSMLLEVADVFSLTVEGARLRVTRAAPISFFPGSIARGTGYSRRDIGASGDQKRKSNTCKAS